MIKNHTVQYYNITFCGIYSRREHKTRKAIGEKDNKKAAARQLPFTLSFIQIPVGFFYRPEDIILTDFYEASIFAGLQAQQVLDVALSALHR